MRHSDGEVQIAIRLGCIEVSKLREPSIFSKTSYPMLGSVAPLVGENGAHC
jgi:hypothetical protein